MNNIEFTSSPRTHKKMRKTSIEHRFTTLFGHNGLTYGKGTVSSILLTLCHTQLSTMTKVPLGVVFTIFSGSQKMKRSSSLPLWTCWTQPYWEKLDRTMAQNLYYEGYFGSSILVIPLNMAPPKYLPLLLASRWTLPSYEFGLDTMMILASLYPNTLGCSWV